MNKEEKINSINNIIIEMQKLLSNWSPDMDDRYPFENSFDEVLLDVISWRNKLEER